MENPGTMCELKNTQRAEKEDINLELTAADASLRRQRIAEGAGQIRVYGQDTVRFELQTRAIHVSRPVSTVTVESRSGRK